MFSRAARMRCASGRFAERHRRMHDGEMVPSSSALAQRGDPGLERAAIVPEPQHVQTDHGFGLLKLVEQVEAAQHRQCVWGRPAQRAFLALLHRRNPVADQPSAGAEQRVGPPHRRPAQCVEDQIVRAEALPPVVAAVVDRPVHAQLRQLPVLSGRRRTVHFGPGGLGELDGRDADAAGRRVHQHPFAGA